MSYFINFDIQNVNRSVLERKGLVQTLLLTGFGTKNVNYISLLEQRITNIDDFYFFTQVTELV